MIHQVKEKQRLPLKRTGLRIVKKKSDITEETLHRGAGWELGL